MQLKEAIFHEVKENKKKREEKKSSLVLDYVNRSTQPTFSSLL
jgi:hypothetical protein